MYWFMRIKFIHVYVPVNFIDKARRNQKDCKSITNSITGRMVVCLQAPDSSINKTDRLYLAEILLKVALNSYHTIVVATNILFHQSAVIHVRITCQSNVMFCLP